MTVSVSIDPRHLAGRGDSRAEHPVHVELIETDGRIVHSGMLGFRLFGGVSRAHPQKSFSLSGRERYGVKRIDYPLFGPDAGKDFRFLVLRNGGSDWGISYLRDALLTGLLRDPSWQLDQQSARPVRVYIGGKYWGLYHLREKINPRYLEDRYGIDKDSLTLMEHEGNVKHGSGEAYRQLKEYISAHDLSNLSHYARLSELMDIDNFQRLQIAQTYFDNRDAGGNIRYWRPDGPYGKFRWIIYDVDQGFGLHRREGWTNNTLLVNTDSTGPAWPNPPWSTLLHRRLLANAGYRHDFVNRSLDYLHTDFSSEAVLERTDAAIASVADEMPRQIARWGGRLDYWEYHVEQLRNYARYRPVHWRQHLREFFNGGEDRRVSITAGRGGYVVLNNNLQVGSDGISGSYFSNYPLQLEAVAEAGYRFRGWRGSGAGDAGSAKIEIDLGEEKIYAFTAVFEPANHPLAELVIINEICPRGKSGGDWLELYNRGEVSVDVTGWFLEDDSHQRFHLPAASLSAGEYLVVCRNGDDFRAVYPDVFTYFGDLPFGLNKETDHIGLYARDGSYVNEVGYRLAPSTDTTFTYALALPGLETANSRNWVREAGLGTPGTANPTYLQRNIVPRQTFWLRMGIGGAVLLLVGYLRVLHLRSRPGETGKDGRTLP